MSLDQAHFDMCLLDQKLPADYLLTGNSPGWIDPRVYRKTSINPAQTSLVTQEEEWPLGLAMLLSDEYSDSDKIVKIQSLLCS
jgi:hypothetical protein